MEEIKILNGKLNLDASQYRMPPNDFIDALNITRNNTEVVHNLNGNILVNNPYLYTTGSTVNKKIGEREDRTRNRIYYLIWNSDNYDVICYYDGITGTIVKLLQNLVDTASVDVTQFNPSYRINHIDIIYRDEGDLIYWTDGLNSPREINTGTILTYGVVTEAFIEAAKRPPLQIPVCIYGNDSTKLTNSLTKSLLQFACRLQNDDLTYTSYSDFSELALPVTVGTDNAIDPTKNNFITVTVETGDKNTTAIEIIFRQLEAGVWSDYFKATHLDKSDLGIGDNGVYDFKFYNNGVYPPTDINEVLQEADSFPKLALSQASANGNTIEYAATTEGYPNISTTDLNVTMTVALVENSGAAVSDPNLTYTNNAGTGIFTFTVTGTQYTGTYYRIVMFIAGGVGVMTMCTYTTIGGDTINTVATALNAAVSVTYRGGVTLNAFQILAPVGSFVLTVDHIPGSGGATIAAESIWNYNSKYHFGQVYFDNQDRVIGGVQSFVAQIDTNNDYEINTLNFTQNGGTPKTNVISAEVNHHPPTGAVKWRWVVTQNLTMGNFLYYITDDFQSDADYYYFGVQNIAYFKSLNSKFNYGSATVTDSTRLRVCGTVVAGVYTANYYTQDYEVLGTVTRTATGGASPANDGTYIKVKIPLSVPSPAYVVNMFICIYEPVLRVDNTSLEVYYGIGNTYDVINTSGVLYHQGQSQDQTVSLPALFTFTGGDIYYHSRTIYTNIVTPAKANYLMPDANYNDFYNSAVNGYGRPRTINVDARETFFPARIRFSQEYQADTNINGLNRFYEDNLIECDRTYNSILKMFILGRELFVFQQLNTGIVPVLTQIVKDTANNPLEANSDILLNKVRYPFKSNPAIGDIPESFAYADGKIFFGDSNLGIINRIAQNGAEALSVVYECNSFFIDLLAAYGKGLDNGIAASGTVYTGNPTVYGGFDNKDSKYIMCFEVINRYSNPTTLTYHQDPVTISFFETTGSMQGFESPYSYHPEGVVSLNNLLVTFKNGQLWKHDSDTMNNFYGTQYNSSITPVFNKNEQDKKTFIAVEEVASVVWDCPEIVTASDEFGTTKQTSKLVVNNFAKLEGNYNASFLRATNSQGGWLNGSSLKGNLCSIKFRAINPTQLVNLNIIKVTSINSALNSR